LLEEYELEVNVPFGQHDIDPGQLGVGVDIAVVEVEDAADSFGVPLTQ
jgi:hypothetical protein